MFGPRQPAVVDAAGQPIDATLGYLVVFREGTLMAVPYDWRRLRVIGEPIPVFPSLSAAPTQEVGPPPTEGGGLGPAGSQVPAGAAEPLPTLLSPHEARIERPADTGPLAPVPPGEGSGAVGPR
jgi:hypothetical protein